MRGRKEGMLGRHEPRQGVEDGEAARVPESDLRGEEGCGRGKGTGVERWLRGVREPGRPESVAVAV